MKITPPWSPALRQSLLAWTALLVVTLLPYPALLTFDAVHVPDDVFVSDLFGGELPMRASMGRMLRAGSLPTWEPSLYGGLPVLGADPLGLLRSPAAALDAFLLVVLLRASLGSYALARRVGASRQGAVLAGFAWAHSGVMTAQLRHTGIVATIAWTPLALALLDRALAPPDEASGRPAAQHARRLAAFAIVLGAQTLAGFPQAVYAALMAYALWSLGRLASWPRDALGRFPLARVSALSLGFASACALGLLMGAAALLPMRELASLSDRAGGVSWAFASHATYWPRAALSFLLPHLNGDASDGTYRGPDLFWESYGYVGLATVALAAGAAVAGWRGRVERTLLAVAALAYLFVLGANTPFYRLAWEHLPAFRGFRFPTRFLFLVELSLVTLAALGLTRFERWYASRASAPRALAASVAAVALVVLDLCAWQPRQNPFVSGSAWISAPQSALTLLREARLGRIVSLGASEAHLEAYNRGPGWRSLDPFFAQRESIEPNTQALWGLDAANGYHPLPLRGPLFVWGHHGVLYSGVGGRLHHVDPTRVVTRPFFAPLLAMQGVTHVLAPVPIADPRFERVPSRSPWLVYRLAEPLGRAWYADGAEAISDRRDALARAQRPGYDPRRTVLLRDPPGAVSPSEGAAPGATVSWRRPEAHRIEVSVDASRSGWLVLSESWHPDWEVTVDGRARAPVEAHLVGQAVRIEPGRHLVRWRFRGTAMRRGVALSVTTLGLLLAIAAATRRRRPASAPDPGARSS